MLKFSFLRYHRTCLAYLTFTRLHVVWSIVLEALCPLAFFSHAALAAELRAAALAGQAERVRQLAQAAGPDLVNAAIPGPGEAASSGRDGTGEGGGSGGNHTGSYGSGSHGSSAAQKGWIALHLAASKGHAEVVKVLLDEGADPSLVTAQGSSALHLAVCSGRVGAIQALVAEGAPCALRDAGGNTALHVAATRGQVSAVLALLEGGAPVDSLNQAGDTALHIAAAAGRVGVVAALVNGGANVDARGPGGATPLMVAAAAGNLAAVKALLKVRKEGKRGAEEMHFFVVREESWGRARNKERLFAGEAFLAFRWAGQASRRGFVGVDAWKTMVCQMVCQMVLIMEHQRCCCPLQAEASFSAADSQGNTALHHAVLGWRAGSDEGYLSVARELLVGGCDFAKPNAAGETPFGMASTGHIRQLKELFTKAEGGVYIGESTISIFTRPGHFESFLSPLA